MLSIILTWIGTVLGMAVLLAMALGAFVVDIDDAMDGRRRKRTEHQDPAQPSTPAA